jgi:phage terminase large subunit-like protein
VYSDRHANRVLAFIERACVIPSGKGAGGSFKLRGWQRDLICPLYGTLNEDGTRQYRTAYISMARKNGKSTLLACLALYHCFADGEQMGQVILAANDRAQASIVFDAAAQIVRNSPILNQRSTIIPSQKRIIDKISGSIIQAVSSDVPTKLGLNVSALIYDELAFAPNRELWDVLTTAVGARTQPMVMTITTASWNSSPGDIGYELYTYAHDLAKGLKQDSTFYSFIREVPQEADWTLEANWKRANPAMGDFRSLEEMRTSFNRAVNIPAAQNTFKMLYLNQWVKQESRWIDLVVWDESAGIVDAAELEGQPCYAGLDLSSTTDLSALVLVFPQPEGAFMVLPFFFLPSDGLRERCLKDHVPYDVWSADESTGLTLTPGNVIDYDYITEKLRELGTRYDIREVAFDRWGMAKISQDLTAVGFTMVPFGQGFQSMSQPTKELQKLVLSGKLHHGGNSILRWMLDCASVEQKPGDLIKLVKPDRYKSSKRIDGLIATVMGLSRALVHNPEPDDFVIALGGWSTTQ